MAIDETLISKRVDRMDNFFRCPYGSRQDAWEIVDSNKMFKVVYKCRCKKLEMDCLEANYSKERCTLVNIILH
jgi:hypothetical protein